MLFLRSRRSPLCTLRPLSAALLLLVAGLAAGCDLFDDDNGEADLDVVLGSWRVVDLVVDGTSIEQRLDAQYEALVFTLRLDGSGREFFDIFGDTGDADPNLTVEGEFTLDSRNDELTLLPDTDPAVDLFYRSPSSSRLELTSSDGDEDALLRLLRIDLQGDIESVQIRLSLNN
jgi:hypothetical protein